MSIIWERLGLAPGAATAEIEAAYAARRAEYTLPDTAPADMQALAAEQLAALDAARTAALNAQPAPSRTLTRREWIGLGAGVALALLIIAVVALLVPAGQPTLGLAVVDRPAPDMPLQTLDGTTLRLADLRGKVVLVNFWYTTCEPCKYETPDLVSAYHDLRSEGLEIVGVNMISQERNLDAVREFAQKYAINYPIVLDTDQQWQDAIGIYWTPHSVFIDSEGRIRYTRINIVSREDIERVLQELKPQPVLN